jgi:hypothetical protein
MLRMDGFENKVPAKWQAKLPVAAFPTLFLIVRRADSSKRCPFSCPSSLPAPQFHPHVLPSHSSRSPPLT